MLGLRPTCLIGDTLETDCLIKDPPKTACLIRVLSYWSPMGFYRHFGLRWDMSVSDGACRSPLGPVDLRWGMSVSDESPIRYVGLQWGMSVSVKAFQGLRWLTDRSPIVIIFS